MYFYSWSQSPIDIRRLAFIPSEFTSQYRWAAPREETQPRVRQLPSVEEKFLKRDTAVSHQQATLLAAGWRNASVSIPLFPGGKSRGVITDSTANSFPKVRLLIRECNYILIHVCRLLSLKVIVICTSINNVWECLFPWTLTSTWYCFSKYLTMIHYCYFKLYFPDNYWDWKSIYWWFAFLLW